MSASFQEAVKRAAQELEIIGGIMVTLGENSCCEDINEEQMGWFGRQIEAISERLDNLLQEVKVG